MTALKSLSLIAGTVMLGLTSGTYAETEENIGWHLVVVNETFEELRIKFLGQDNWECFDLCEEQIIRSKNTREFYSAAKPVNVEMSNRLSFEINGVVIDFHDSEFPSNGKALAEGTVYRAVKGYGCEDYDDMTLSSSDDKAIQVEINSGTNEVCRGTRNTITSTIHFIKRTNPSDH